MGRVLFKKGAYMSSGKPDQSRWCSSKEDGAMVYNNQLVTDGLYILYDMVAECYISFLGSLGK